MDPCGIAGGTDPRNGHAGDAVFTTVRSSHYNATMGDRGSDVLPYAPSGTKWLAGTAVEVGWAITYNHGGGCAPCPYAVRLAWLLANLNV